MEEEAYFTRFKYIKPIRFLYRDISRGAIDGKHIQFTQPFAVPGSGTFSFFFCTVGKTEEREKTEI